MQVLSGRQDGARQSWEADAASTTRDHKVTKLPSTAARKTAGRGKDGVRRDEGWEGGDKLFFQRLRQGKEAY